MQFITNFLKIKQKLLQNEITEPKRGMIFNYKNCKFQSEI